MLLPATPPLPTEDGQVWSQAGQGTAPFPCTGGHGEMSRHRPAPNQVLPFGLRAMLTATLLPVCQQTKSTGRARLHLPAEDRVVTSQINMRILNQKIVIFKKMRGTRLSTLLQFPVSKQNSQQSSPTWSVIRQGTGLSATYFKLLQR